MKYILLLFLCIPLLILGQGSIGGAGDLYFQKNTYSYGIGAGASHYIGDLNPSFEKIIPGISINAFLRKNFNNYIALRYQFAYLNFGYSDKFSNNSFRRTRNLSFQTDVYEFSVQGDFNFLSYFASLHGHNFTPYINMGIGICYFEPYTYYNNKKEYLRNLQTENVKYLPVSFIIPFGIGIKWGINRRINMGIELSTRFTFTDYIDDVSTNYIGLTNDGSIKSQLQDRSQELGTPIGIPNRQRGQSTNFDLYFSTNFYISFNLFQYYCP